MIGAKGLLPPFDELPEIPGLHLRHAWEVYGPLTITIADLQATLASQGVVPEVGDIWCVRTGWVSGYRGLDADTRGTYALAPTSAGLYAGEDMARFLWNAHPAALCCDNPAVEVVPGDPAAGSLHRRLIPALGLALGEMFDFERLAQRCQADGRWTFMFVAAPLRLPDGLGSRVTQSPSADRPMTE